MNNKKQVIPQPHNADKPWHREEEPRNTNSQNIGKAINVKQPPLTITKLESILSTAKKDQTQNLQVIFPP